MFLQSLLSGPSPENGQFLKPRLESSLAQSKETRGRQQMQLQYHSVLKLHFWGLEQSKSMGSTYISQKMKEITVPLGKKKPKNI